MTTLDGGPIDVVILAGGKGTRLQSVVSDVPKPLAPVNGRPFIDYQFALLKKQPAVGRVVLAIGHLAERVIAHYAAHTPDVDLHFAVETTTLGTAGALRNALSKTTSPHVLVLNGDSIFHWSLATIRDAHAARGDSAATIALLNVNDVSRYGRVTFKAGRVVAFEEKTTVQQAGTINAGVYLFDRSVIASIPDQKEVSLEREVLPGLAQAGRLTAVPFRSDFIDIGLPETYAQAAGFVRTLFGE